MCSTSPSPMKVVDQLDSTNVVDPLQQYWKHFMPNIEMDELDEDSWAISEMEMEYARIPST